MMVIVIVIEMDMEMVMVMVMVVAMVMVMFGDRVGDGDGDGAMAAMDTALVDASPGSHRFPLVIQLRDAIAVVVTGRHRERTPTVSTHALVNGAARWVNGAARWAARGTLSPWERDSS